MLFEFNMAENSLQIADFVLRLREVGMQNNFYFFGKVL